jgi:cytochrome c5
MKVRTTILLLALLGLVIVSLVVACGGGEEGPAALPPEEETSGELSGEELLEDRCATCHALDIVKGATKTQAEWESTVERMIEKGAELTDAEAQVLVDYLASTYGP